MRLLIVCLLAGVSMAMAAEQPADMRAANAAATEATPPSPEVAPESEAAPAPAEPATETTDAATAPAETTDDPVEAARLEAERELAEDREFTKAGYKPKVVKGKKKYCQVVQNSGTRIGKQTQCYSPEQVRAMIAAREAAEET